MKALKLLDSKQVFDDGAIQQYQFTTVDALVMDFLSDEREARNE